MNFICFFLIFLHVASEISIIMYVIYTVFSLESAALYTIFN